MRITFYHSTLCPRCRMARRALKEIAAGREDIEIEEIDVLRHPLDTLQRGIRMVPALQTGDRVLSGIYLKRLRIQKFIDKS